MVYIVCIVYQNHYEDRSQDAVGPWSHGLSQNANLKLQGFLPYQRNKDRCQKSCLNSPRNHQKKCYDPCLYGGAEIFVIFGLHFGRNDDLISSC